MTPEPAPRTLLDALAARPEDGVDRVLPPVAYTSPEVLAWELRELYAGGWVCLGRLEELLPGDGPRATTQRTVVAGDVSCLLTRAGQGVRMFANTCRHRAHELLGSGEASSRLSVVCPYHAWSYALDGRLQAAPGFRDDPRFDPDEHGLVELGVQVWGGWVFADAARPLRSTEDSAASFDLHLGALRGIIEPYRPERLVAAARHTYEVAANWKVIAENYHECYHCPLIHPELCQVTPPDSGDNYDLPGDWVGGSMTLREGMETMSMTGAAAGPRLPGVEVSRVEYLQLLPNLFVSAHPDYVMTHRLVPLTPDRTRVECAWLVAPHDVDSPGLAGAVEFWDLTNGQDWTACESVQRGLSSPHARPGPLAPNEDAVVALVRHLTWAYLGRRG